jgi:hypothetical protein
MTNIQSRIEKIPGVQWAMVHPRLSAWIVLSAGMIILLAIEARDVGLLPGQWIALMVACILVAGACVWIISWEDSDEAESVAPPATPTTETVEAAKQETQA